MKLEQVFYGRGIYGYGTLASSIAEGELTERLRTICAHIGSSSCDLPENDQPFVLQERFDGFVFMVCGCTGAPDSLGRSTLFFHAFIGDAKTARKEGISARSLWRDGCFRFKLPEGRVTACDYTPSGAREPVAVDTYIAMVPAIVRITRGQNLSLLDVLPPASVFCDWSTFSWNALKGYDFYGLDYSYRIDAMPFDATTYDASGCVIRLPRLPSKYTRLAVPPPRRRFRRRAWFIALILALLTGLCLSFYSGLFAAPVRNDSRDGRPLGVVLAGGGAKGAYQLGVWKAMEEYGLTEDVRAFSGTSIGGINSALFAANPRADFCLSIWTDQFKHAFPRTVPNIDFKRVLSRRPAAMKEAIAGELREKGALDTGPFRSMLERCLPPKWTKGPPYVYLTAQREDAAGLRRFMLNGRDFPVYVDYLLATSAVPYVFPPVEIEGVRYVDGGLPVTPDSKAVDNVPVKPLLEHHPELKTIIIVYLEGGAEISSRFSESYRGPVRIVEVVPSIAMNTGPYGLKDTVMFTESKVRYLYQVGYADACKVFAAAFPNRTKKQP